MPAKFSRFLTFNTLVWIVTFIMIYIVLGHPLLMNLWVYTFWTKTPCAYYEQNDLARKETFTYRGKSGVYNSPRRDTWDGASVSQGPQLVPDPPFNSVCWVSPFDEKQAVHYVDA